MTHKTQTTPSAPPFAVGDVVYLKSGSPKMTVEMIVDHGDECYAVAVAWMVYETNEVRGHQFDAQALRLAD